MDRLRQILSQLEQDLKDSIDDEKKRRDIARYIKNTKLVIGRLSAMNH